MADALQELMSVLHQELTWQQDLAEILAHKLDAMRHYDTSRLEALSEKEQQLTQKIQFYEQKRNEAVQRATRQLIPDYPSVRISARELAQAAKEPTRSRLLTVGSMLKEAAQKVQRLNEVNRLATDKIMGHFNQIFQIIAQSGRDIGLYSREGKRPLLEQNRLLDATA